jgi:hypothetical protein
MWIKLTIPLVLCVLVFTLPTEAQRRVKFRSRPVQVESEEETSQEEINRPVVSFYRAEPKQDEQPQDLVYINNEENFYQPTPTPRSRSEYRPVTTARSQSIAPKSKPAENPNKQPPVQTIRNYNKVNDDGSFTFGYEAADGSFKEETRGTDCVVRGKYGYIDPDGNKREFTYVSGNPCDPNNPDGSDEEEDKRNQSEEDSDENIPQNYPKRPVPRPRPTQAPVTRAPTTVFQNRYNAVQQEVAEEEEEQEYVPPTRPQYVQTTPAPAPAVNSYSPSAVNITPKPIYRFQNNVPQVSRQAPPTTYRPITIVTQKPITATQSPITTKFNGFQSTTRGPIDFDAEFKKFQQENRYSQSPSPVSVTPAPVTPQTTKSVKIANNPVSSTGNPIYQTQLVFNPSTGQYDSQLYQSIAQTDSEFTLNHRIQPFVQQYPIPQQAAPTNSFSQTPLYNRATQAAQTQSQPQPQIPQQVYQKQQSELQFLNSQQLFQQQLQMQQSQLQRDRLEAKKAQGIQAHRFQLPQGELLESQFRPIAAQPAAGQQYYYVQPGQSQGQIDNFLRAHNIEY